MLSRYLFILLVPGVLFASGGDHQSGPLDLLFPFINFFVFAGGLVYLLRKGMKSYFDEYSDHIKQQVTEADNRCKEATFRVNDYTAKLKNFAGISEKNIRDAQVEVDKFAKHHEEEIELVKARMVKDYTLKVESEKNSVMKAVDDDFFDSIINEVKTRVSKDSALSDQITDKLLQKIG